MGTYEETFRCGGRRGTTSSMTSGGLGWAGLGLDELTKWRRKGADISNVFSNCAMLGIPPWNSLGHAPSGLWEEPLPDNPNPNTQRVYHTEANKQTPEGRRPGNQDVRDPLGQRPTPSAPSANESIRGHRIWACCPCRCKNAARGNRGEMEGAGAGERQGTVEGRLQVKCRRSSGPLRALPSERVWGTC
jgi:hypothetical protein